MTTGQRPAAIVTPIEGTTRDVLEVMLDVSGYPLILADTAGLRSQTTDFIEKEGIERALKTYEEADLALVVLDCKKYLSWCKSNTENDFERFLKVYLQQLNIDDNYLSKKYVIIANKIDLVQSKDTQIFDNLNINVMSCKSEEGVSNLLKQITNRLRDMYSEPSKDHPCMSQSRHREHLSQCLKYLGNSLIQSDISDSVLMAEEVRKALRQLEKITGEVTNNQLLDIIFKEFCIGK